MRNKSKWYHIAFSFIWARRYIFLHFILLGILTKYILNHWEICVSMQFFTQFNGNNILFLVWIADIMLFFYDVELKEGKILRRNIEEAKKQVNEKTVEQEIGKRNELINRAISEISTQINGGDKQQ